ncbi:MAG: hypothetical protein AABY22_32250 [Nanoarchaeota archaeon]
MKKEKICGIYKITSPTRKIYIGLSYNIYIRFLTYKNCTCYKQRRLYNSIKKHGWNAHTFEIIHVCNLNISKKELNDLEIYYEELYDSTNSKTGLNLRKCGGSGGKHHEETKELIGKSNKLAYSTPEMKEMCRLQNIGRKRNDEIRKNQRESKKKKGKGDSKYLGVAVNKCIKGGNEYIYWIVSPSYKCKRIKSKRFPFTPDGEIKAALYYNEISIKLNGEYAVLNVISGNSDVAYKPMENKRRKLVLNTQTGIYYPSVIEAFKSFGIGSDIYLARKLRGDRKNNTNFIYV